MEPWTVEQVEQVVADVRLLLSLVGMVMDLLAIGGGFYVMQFLFGRRMPLERSADDEM